MVQEDRDLRLAKFGRATFAAEEDRALSWIVRHFRAQAVVPSADRVANLIQQAWLRSRHLLSDITRQMIGLAMQHLTT